VTAVLPATLPVVTRNQENAAPVGTVIVAGTLADAEDEVSAMVLPGVRAGALSATKQIDVPEAVITVVKHAKAFKAGACCCAIETVWPPIVSEPVRALPSVFAVSDQVALLPEAETDAHATVDVTGAVGQSSGEGESFMVPEDASAFTAMLVELKA
jgi:hypothetical protein